MKNLLLQNKFLLIFFIICIFLPILFDSSFALTLLSKMGVLIIFSLAYNMLLGQGGMLSFGHAIYFGLAGYISIHALNLIASESIIYIPIILFPILGAIVGLLLGIGIGYISTKRAGTAFAMISLGFGEMITALTLIFVVFFNGEDGIQADRILEIQPLNISFGPRIEVFYLILFWCLIATAVMYFFTRTPFGRMSNAVRDNPQRAAFIGYDIRKVRWQAFALSSMFAGAAGSLHAINYEHIGFESVSVIQSGAVLFMTFIGGAGHFIGPIIGAIFLTFLDSTLADITEAWLLYLGLTFVLLVMFAPGGLAGLIIMHSPIVRADPRLLLNLIKPYFYAISSTLIGALGSIGIIELIYSLSMFHAGDKGVVIFWIPFNPSSIFSWVIFSLLVITGVYFSKKTYPIVYEEWNTVFNKVKERISS